MGQLIKKTKEKLSEIIIALGEKGAIKKVNPENFFTDNGIIAVDAESAELVLLLFDNPENLTILDLGDKKIICLKKALKEGELESLINEMREKIEKK